ncbi:MAG: phage portal protein [Acidobacteria bacterium]|nr:phage portal protein [Acidobacteriota bacterium]
MTPDQSKATKRAVERINTKNAAYAKFYAYYDGRHTWNFSSKKFKNKYGQRLQELRENLCRVVVKAPASRLEVIGFQSETEIQNAAWDIWKGSNMPLQSGVLHREAFKTGDAYLIVWPNEDNTAVFYPNPAANMTVWKDPESGQTTEAAKFWKGNDGFYYLTLYYADRIEKYISSTKADGKLSLTNITFKPREVKGESWPLENPYKQVPVFHFVFENEMNDFGRSLLTDVIPLNDALNKSYADIFVAQEYNSMRQRWIAGLRVEEDEETGKKIEPYKADDATWVAEDNEAKFGEFTDADLEKMLKVKQEAVRDVALVSGIPPSYFNLEQIGSAISGEALRKIEARFTAMIQDAQRSFGETWANAMSFALEVEEKLRPDLPIETQWADAAPISESEQLDNALKKKNLGWSLEQIQRDFGLTDKQIKAMLAETKERDKTKMENAAKFFDGGLPNS